MLFANYSFAARCLPTIVSSKGTPLLNCQLLRQYRLSATFVKKIQRRSVIFVTEMISSNLRNNASRPPTETPRPSAS
jgi:hypothetical protein